MSALSSKNNEDDFFMMFLLMSCQLPLLAFIFSEAKLKDFLSSAELQRRDRRIRRCSLLDANQSPWQKLYHSRNEQSLITFTGFNYASFDYLLSKFQPFYRRYSPYTGNGKISVVRHPDGTRGGRPRSLDAAACLGLALGYTRTKGSLFSVQMVFGVTHSVLSAFLRYSIKLLYKVLKEEPSARVVIPSDEEIREYQENISSNFPVLDGTWCVVDGLKIKIQKSGDEEIQNAYYNGWLHSHFIGCIFVFAPSGVIVSCIVNAPGSWHDSYIAENGGLYETLRNVYSNTGGIAVVDSAFSKKRCPFLIKSGKEKVGETPANRTLRIQATSLRQSAEWGMRAIQGSFPRLKDTLLFSEEMTDRKVFLNLIPMLLNFRTRHVGLNRLTATYYPTFHQVGDDVLDMFLN